MNEVRPHDWMETTVERLAPDCVAVAPHGPLDLGTGGVFERVLLGQLDDGVRFFVVDLSDVAFCDSTGLSALLRIHRGVSVHSGWVRLVGVTGQVLRVLQMTNIDRLIRRYPDRQSALGSLASSTAAGEEETAQP